jgi:hypothetical protein
MLILKFFQVENILKKLIQKASCSGTLESQRRDTKYWHYKAQ